jgi:protein gp37
MAETAIEWATHVWNPVTGCDRVSPGCARCYALTYAGRLKAMGQPKYQRDGGKASGPGFGVTLHEAALAEPAHWRKPRRVFVNSMSDLFHEEVPDEFIARVFAVMGNAREHRFLVLTKRPGRMRDLIRSWRFHKMVRQQISAVTAPAPSNGWAYIAWCDDSYFDNVWLGVSIENRRFVDRADLLRQTSAAVRFISAEPLLGPLLKDGGYVWPKGVAPPPDAILAGEEWADDYRGPDLDLAGIDWLICGGESGPGARPMRLEWARDLRDACQAAGVAYFFKQVGGRTPKAGGRELDGRTWDEMPEAAHA